MKIRALIVDDEPLAQNVIQQYSNKLPELNIVSTCPDAICAHKILQEECIDLLFLDINMPKLSGISFLRNLKNPPLVIFTTAYSEYALEGFDAIDYLKKPFSFDRFCKAYFRAEELLQLKRSSTNVSIFEKEPDFLYIKADKKLIKLKFSEIYYIEGLGDYIKIYLKNEKIVTNLSMKKILTLLPENHFYRTHKSYIISLDKIDLVEGNMTVINGRKLPIGNSYRQEFIKLIKNNLAE